MARVEGRTVQVGDYVCFKCDLEQGGVITKINGNQLTLRAPWDEGFIGEYIGGQQTHVETADRCWIEGELASEKAAREAK